MRAAIIGSRNFDDYFFLCNVLRRYKIDHIVSGGANGADSLAHRYAINHSIPTTIYLADWAKYGRAAGFRRNKDIVNDSEIVLAFWDGESKGTKNSIEYAKKLGKKVKIYYRNDMTVNVMLDIETMSQQKNAAIVSIGAVKFNEHEILDKFYVNVDPLSCKEVGLHFQKETIEWWKKQDKAVRDALKVDPRPIGEALDRFSEWFGPKSIETWGNGATFDCVIVENAFKVLNKQVPWKYYDERCFRTLCAIFKVHHSSTRVGNLHNALDDAISQVLTLQSLFSGGKK